MLYYAVTLHLLGTHCLQAASAGPALPFALGGACCDLCSVFAPPERPADAWAPPPKAFAISLLLCGDIEANPGPALGAGVFNCPWCELPVEDGSNDLALCCDACDC